MIEIEYFFGATDMQSEIYLFMKLATGPFDDVTDVKSAEKPQYLTIISSSRAASAGRHLHVRSNNVLNWLNCSVNHQDLTNT